MDKYSVVLTSRALRDLDDIYAYITKELQNPEAALRIVDKIEGDILSLENIPHRCPERRCGAYAGKGYRQLFVEHYTVIFRVDEAHKQVVVVTTRYSKSSF